MISGKLAWLILLHCAILKGCSCFNLTQKANKEALAISEVTLPELNASLIERTTSDPEIKKKNSELFSTPAQNITLNGPILNNSTNVNQTQLEITRIFLGDSNITARVTAPSQKINVSSAVTTSCLNVSSENLTCIDQSWNDTFKTNYSTVAEAVGSSEDTPVFRLSNSAAIAAGVFLLSAVLGYVSCVGYRRFLQRKYGNSQILIGEEVYDTTDLRNFEI